MLDYQRVVDAVMKQQTPQLHQAVIKNVTLSMVDVNVFFLITATMKNQKPENLINDPMVFHY
jgi:hypothetical protein